MNVATLAAAAGLVWRRLRSHLKTLLQLSAAVLQVSRVGAGNATERSTYVVSAQLADHGGSSGGSGDGGSSGAVAVRSAADSPSSSSNTMAAHVAVVPPGGEQHGKRADPASTAAAVGAAVAAGGRNHTAAHGQDLVSQLKGMGSSLGSALAAAADGVLGSRGSSGGGSEGNATAAAAAEGSGAGGAQAASANATANVTQASPPPPPPPHRCVWGRLLLATVECGLQAGSTSSEQQQCPLPSMPAALQHATTAAAALC